VALTAAEAVGPHPVAGRVAAQAKTASVTCAIGLWPSLLDFYVFVNDAGAASVYDVPQSCIMGLTRASAVVATLRVRPRHPAVLHRHPQLQPRKYAVQARDLHTRQAASCCGC